MLVDPDKNRSAKLMRILMDNTATYAVTFIDQFNYLPKIISNKVYYTTKAGFS